MKNDSASIQVTLSAADIKKVSHCRRCIKQGLIDLNAIDSILMKVEQSSVPPDSKPKKLTRRAQLKAQFETSAKMTFA